jgi:hypothetical protein
MEFRENMSLCVDCRFTRHTPIAECGRDPSRVDSMNKKAVLLLMSICLVGAGCQSPSNDNSALQDQLEEARAERDDLAERVAELEAQLAAGSGSETTVVEQPDDTEPAPATEETTAASAETTVAPVSVGPAAIDASPYVAVFGDLSGVSLPDGEPGKVSIIVQAGSIDSSGSVSMIVRNNTSEPVGSIDVTGTARDAAGSLVGSGSSQGFEPAIVGPGEIAFGYVYFDSDLPIDSTFEFSVSASEVDDFSLPVTITEISNTGDQIIGILTNKLDVEVSGPIGANGICLGPDGSILNFVRSYAEQDKLAPGGTGSFAISLFGDECAAGIMAASGYSF